MFDYEYEIKEYINNANHNGALLITGQWGSGKSYFIKQLAEKINEQEKYLVIIVSLFGATSSEEIKLSIKEQLLKNLFDNDDSKVFDFLVKGSKFAKSVFGVLKDVNGVFKGINTALNVNIYDFFEVTKSVPFKSDKTENKRELVLVFDDFERHDNCMDSTELLGCINQYVENESISTIIVADESKIDDPVYDEFKEKVIERTVHFEPDASSIIKSISNSFSNLNESYHEFIMDNEEDIIDTFLDSKTNNFRSFKTTIIDFERIYELCKKLDVPSSTISGLFLTFSCLVYEIKSNRFVPTDRYGNIFKNLNSNSYFKESYDSYLTKQSEKDLAEKIDSVNYTKYNAIYRLSYLQDWLLSGKWDKDGLENEITLRFLPSDNHPIDFIYASVLDLTDSIVEEQMPLVLQKAYGGELTREQYILLLSKIANLISIKCTVPMNVDYNKLNAGWDIHERLIKANPSLEKMGHYFVSPEVLENLGEEGKAFYNKVEKMEDRIVAIIDYNNYLNYLTNIYSSNYKSTSISFLCFDKDIKEKFISAFNSANSNYRRDLISGLKRMRFDDNRVSHIEEIQLSKDMLNELVADLELLKSHNEDSISEFVLSESITVVNEIVEKINIESKTII